MKLSQSNINKIRLQYASKISWKSTFAGFMFMFVCSLVLILYDDDTIVVWIIMIGIIVLFSLYNIREYKYTYLDYISTINKNDKYKIQYDWYELLKDSCMAPRKYIIGITIPIYIILGLWLYILINKSLFSQHTIDLFKNMLINILFVYLMYLGISILLNYLYVRKVSHNTLK